MSITSIKNRLQQIYWNLVDHPFDSFESVLAIAIPLILVVLMFNWRVKQSMKKQKRIQNRRDKLLKKLNRNKDEQEEEDEVVQQAIKLMEQKAKKLN
uniref:Small integral membrane protein 15 n=1 Tax=Caenorhabditis tropicalis TaxID=1561998 RepID=A0A1I7V0V7_9PELO